MKDTEYPSATIIHSALSRLNSKLLVRFQQKCPSVCDLDIRVSTRHEFNRFEISCGNEVDDFIYAYDETLDGAVSKIEEKLISYSDIAASKRAKAAQLIAEANAISEEVL